MRGGWHGLAAGLVLGWACGAPAPPEPASPEASPGPEAAVEPAASCPAEPIDVAVAPGTRPEHRRVEHWIAKLPPGAADEVLVPAAGIEGLNAQSSAIEGGWRDPFTVDIADPEHQRQQLAERMDWIAERVADGRLLEGQAGSVAQARRISDEAEPTDEFHVVADEASLWCIALDSGLYKPPVDLDFDRNRCASLHPGEVVRVLRSGEGGQWLYVHAGHTTGWLHAPTLTPTLPAVHLRELMQGPHLFSTDDDLRSDGGRPLRMGVRIPVVGREGELRRVLVPTAEGLVEDTVSASERVVEGELPLTRRNAWTMALRELDTPYGWGGRAGHRDCSRLTRDVLVGFGLQMPRHSGVQGKLGSTNVDVSAMDEDAKRAEIRRQAERGLVLLYMPGHIMMYLGQDEGQQYAVSAISEYLVPCVGGPDTVYRLGRVAVTTLELGRGSERTAYIQRITNLVVLAPS
ncbi:MAG: SH3 domain-containing protein [Myxococcales bacterium]|nr:SH3 domain-containing protein [Myxococcales bacterium]